MSKLLAKNGLGFIIWLKKTWNTGHTSYRPLSLHKKNASCFLQKKVRHKGLTQHEGGLISS